MKIKVTEEDISSGIKGSFFSCPIALAVKRSCPNEESIRVNNEFVIFRHGENRKTIELPAIAENFITNFDFGFVAVHPFEFDLDYEC